MASWIDDQIKQMALGGTPFGALAMGMPGAQFSGSTTGTRAPVANIPNFGSSDLFGGGNSPSAALFGGSPVAGMMAPEMGATNTNPVAQPDDDLTAIYKQLLANLATGGSSGGGIDEGAIRAQVAAKYDPQIKGIRREIGSNRERFKNNKRDVKTLYNELENDYLSGLEDSSAQYAADKETEAARSAAIKARMQENAGNLQADMSGEFQNLGIEAALDPASRQMNDDLAYLSEISDVEGASTQRLIEGQERANRDYYQQGATLANERGAEVRNDLRQDFTDYLTARRGDISDLNAARANEFSSLLAQAQAAQTSNQPDIWSRLLQLGNFGMDLQKLQQSGAAAAAGPSYDSGMLGASSWLSQSVSPDRAPALMGVLQNVLQSQQVREGRFETPNGDIVNTTPEQVVKMAMDSANQQGISDAEKVALMNAIYAYYGRLK